MLRHKDNQKDFLEGKIRDGKVLYVPTHRKGKDRGITGKTIERCKGRRV